MADVIITGAAGGLGSCFVKLYLEKGYRVHAFARSLKQNLRELGGWFPERLYLYEADIGDIQSVEKASLEVAGTTDKVDVIINAAGVLPKDSMQPFETVDVDSFMSTFNVNTLGHLRVIQKNYNLLKKGTAPIVVNISSAGGSFVHIVERDDRKEYPYAYCMSKAALNMGSAIFQRYGKKDGIRIICVHPGVLETVMNMENPFGETLVKPEYSAQCIYELIEKERGKEKGYLFFNYDGEVFPY